MSTIADDFVYRNDPDFGRRFELAWKMAPLPYRDMNQSELARAFGISQQAIFTYTKGHRIPMIRNGIDICRRLNVSIAWLYMNEGPMRPIELNEFSAFTQQISELNEEQRKLIQWEVSLMKKGVLPTEKLRDAIIQLTS
jgi:DNA-binding XRE family transcriptional regulator